MSDSGTMLDLEQKIEQLLQQKYEETLTARYSNIRTQSLEWLVLCPSWTLDLAIRCHFPTARGESVPELFDKLVERRIAQRIKRSPDRRGEPQPDLYVAANNARGEIWERYLGIRSNDAETGDEKTTFMSQLTGNIRIGRERYGSELRETLTEIGTAVAKTENDLPDVPEKVLRWAQVARRASSEQKMIAFFDKQVEQGYQWENSGEILNWIEATRTLAEILAYKESAELSIAIERASRKMELLHRRESDLSHLKYYFRRRELITPFNQLMDGPDEYWALHYIGAGGVGKTMLMRDLKVYLTGWADPVDSGCSRPEDKSWLITRPRTATARIDFDYLNADYPRLAPGILLEAFAAELRDYDESGRVIYLFDQAARALRRQRQELLSGATDAGLRPTEHPDFLEAMRLFITALRTLDRPILLILDTCEELAKVSVDHTLTSNIEETFRILRALHDGVETLLDKPSQPADGVPQLRVIFSGRRPLARAGFLQDGDYQWHCPQTTLPPRPFLRLYQIRGFTQHEADRYLSCAGVDESLTGPIFAASRPDAGMALTIQHRAEPADAGNQPRCNPYKLGQFLDWALETPPPQPEEIAQAVSTTYIDVRIIRRMADSPLKKLLPATAVLGHPDKEMLQELQLLTPGQLDTAWAELGRQPWINHRFATALDGNEHRQIFDVERGVRNDLLVYFKRSGENLDAIRQQLAPLLQQRTLQSELGILNWSDIDAALSVSQQDAAQGAKWWQELELRMTTDRDTKWINRVLGVLLDEDGAAGQRREGAGMDTPSENVLRPFVLTTQAMALHKEGKQNRLFEMWHEIADKANARRHLPIFNELWLRAVCGQIRAACATNIEIPDSVAEALWRALPDFGNAIRGEPRLATAVLAACEALVETAESAAQTPLLTGPQQLADLMRPSEQAAAKAPPLFWTVLQAWACMLGARAAFLLSDYERTVAYINQALDLERLIANSSTEIHALWWHDWDPPAEFSARIKLEFIRLSYPAILPPEMILDQLGPLDLPVTSIDSDRLASAFMQLQLAMYAVPREHLSSYGEIDPNATRPALPEAILTSRTPLSNAHRGTPPFFVTLARAYAAAGDVDSALVILRYVINQTDFFTLPEINHADRALLTLLRTMRLNEEDLTAGSSLRLQNLDDLFLQRNFQALWGSRFQEADQLPPELVQTIKSAVEKCKLFHSCWRTLPRRDKAVRLVTAIRWVNQLGNMDALFNENTKQSYWGQALYLDLQTMPGMELPRGIAVSPDEWWQAHRDQPEEALLLILYKIQNTAGQPEKIELPPQLVKRLGTRRTAEMLMSIGTMVALTGGRQPAAYFQSALTQFRECADPAGIVLAITAAALHGPRPIKLNNSLELQENYFRLANQSALPNSLPWPGPGRPEVKIPIWEEPVDSSDQGLEIPTWTELTELSIRGRKNEFQELPPTCWRPWITRLIYLLHKAAPPAAGAESAVTTDLLEMIRTRHEGVLPAEWEAVAGGTAVRPGQPPAEENDDDWLGMAVGFGIIGAGVVGLFFLIRWLVGRVVDLGTVPLGDQFGYFLVGLLGLSLLGSIIGILRTVRQPKRDERESNLYLSIGLLMIIIILIGGFYLARWLTNFLIDTSQFSLGVQIGGYLAELLLMLLSGWLISWSSGDFRSLREARSPLVMAISRTEQEMGATGGFRRSTNNGVVQIQLNRLIPQRWLRIRADREYSSEPLLQATLQTNGLAPYRQLAVNLNEELVTELKERKTAVGRRQMEVFLQPAPTLSALCWEAMVALSANGSGDERFADLKFRCRRQLRGAQPLPARWPKQIAVWIADDIAGQIGQRGWQTRRIQIIAPEREKITEPHNITTLHVIGTVEESTAGLRIRLVGGGAYRAQMSMGSAETLDQRSHLYSAMEITKRYPRLNFCILQGAIESQFSPDRYDSDRLLAGKTRTFAADLVSQGVPVVLIIPPLTSSVAVETLNLLNSRFLFWEKSNFSLSDLQKAITNIQDLILETSGDPDAADSWERALDVTLTTVNTAPGAGAGQIVT